MRGVCAPAACAAWRAQVACTRPASGVAELVLRRWWRGGRHRVGGQGRRGGHGRARHRQCRVRRCPACTLAAVADTLRERAIAGRTFAFRIRDRSGAARAHPARVQRTRECGRRTGSRARRFGARKAEAGRAGPRLERERESPCLARPRLETAEAVHRCERRIPARQREPPGASVTSDDVAPRAREGEEAEAAPGPVRHAGQQALTRRKESACPESSKTDVPSSHSWGSHGSPTSPFLFGSNSWGQTQKLEDTLVRSFRKERGLWGLSIDATPCSAGVFGRSRSGSESKRRAAVPGSGEHAGLNKSAIASIFAALGGALWFWRKKSDESPSS